MAGFTELEKAVLQNICQSFPNESLPLQAQLDTASMTSRENMGAGFYTNFAVSHETHALTGERLRSGGEANLKGMSYPMGFILWLADGYANCLEGYALGDDSTSSLDLESVSFEMLSQGQSGL